eukprot:1008853-Prymnesium_polylepis.1
MRTLWAPRLVAAAAAAEAGEGETAALQLQACADSHGEELDRVATEHVGGDKTGPSSTAVEVLVVLSSLTALTLDAVEQDPPRARAVEVPTYDANMRQSTRFEEVLREERRLFLAATSQGLEQR